MEARNNAIAKELRIGNWVYVYGKNMQVTIGGLAVFQYDCKPIELNEEWLKRLGFEKVMDSITIYSVYEIQRDVDNIRHVFEIMHDNRRLKFYLRGNHLEIKYVHQLQNLYFALTGEELTFTP